MSQALRPSDRIEHLLHTWQQQPEAHAGLPLLTELAGAGAQAYRRYRLWMHRERLRGNETVTVPVPQAQPHASAVMSLWAHVFEQKETDDA